MDLKEILAKYANTKERDIEEELAGRFHTRLHTKIYDGKPWNMDIFFQTGPIENGIRNKLDKFTKEFNQQLGYSAFKWTETSGFHNISNGRQSIHINVNQPLAYDTMFRYLDGVEKLLADLPTKTLLNQ